jgi:hypothetical protein
VRFKASQSNQHGTDGSFLEFYDDSSSLIASVRTERDDEKYHAMAYGDTTQEGASSFSAADGQPYWVDVRISVGADITIDGSVRGTFLPAGFAPTSVTG